MVHGHMTNQLGPPNPWPDDPSWHSRSTSLKINRPGASGYIDLLKINRPGARLSRSEGVGGTSNRLSRSGGWGTSTFSIRHRFSRSGGWGTSIFFDPGGVHRFFRSGGWGTSIFLDLEGGVHRFSRSGGWCTSIFLDLEGGVSLRSTWLVPFRFRV